MKPTQFALSLQDVLNDSVEAMERLIQRESFDPHSLQRRFIVSTADSVVLTLVNKLISELRTEAPEVTVQFIDPHSEDLQALRATEIDLLILPKGVLDTSGMHEIELYPHICVYDYSSFFALVRPEKQVKVHSDGQLALSPRATLYGSLSYSKQKSSRGGSIRAIGFRSSLACHRHELFGLDGSIKMTMVMTMVI